MKITRKLIQEIANGNTWMTGEPVANARLIDELLFPEFEKYAIGYEGYDDCMADVQDCILDFFVDNAQIRIEVDKDIHPSGIWQVFGVIPAITLEKMYDEICNMRYSVAERFEGKKFTIRGIKGTFQYIETYFHYCFGEGHYTEEQLLDMCRI